MTSIPTDYDAARAALTLDPTERHGFEYQSWLGFSIFAGGVRGARRLQPA